MCERKPTEKESEDVFSMGDISDQQPKDESDTKPPSGLTKSAWQEILNRSVPNP